MLVHICETPLVASVADSANVTEVVLVYAAPLLMMIELEGGVVSRVIVSENGDALAFPVASLNQT